MQRRREQQPRPPAADATVLGSLLKTSGSSEPLCADRSLKLSNHFISKPKSSAADSKGRKRGGRKKKIQPTLDHTIWSVTHPDKTPPPPPAANRPLNDKEIMVILKQNYCYLFQITFAISLWNTAMMQSAEILRRINFFNRDSDRN